MKMKRFALLGLLFAASVCGVHAQVDNANTGLTDDYSTYLNTAIKQLQNGDCQKARSNYNVYKEMSRKSTPWLENAINECIEQQKKAASQTKEDKPNPYIEAGKNRYIAWGIGDVGYPFTFGTSLEGRIGKTAGVGLYGKAGVGTASGDFYDYETHFDYAGGIKFYPYRGLFFDVGYGTIRIAQKEIEVGHGLQFHVGYNVITGDLHREAQFFLGVSAGASWNVVSHEFMPTLGLRIGVAWHVE